jgi:hypothetical protein
MMTTSFMKGLYKKTGDADEYRKGG